MPTNWLTGFWGRFVVADKTVDVVKNMSIVGLVTALVGSYFQYTSWREEQNIARYKEDFAAATSAFADTSNLLTAAVNTQQILFFSFKFALDAKVEADKDAFLTKSGRAAYKDYVDARLAFRKASDLLARKMEIYIDWPSNPYRDPASATALGIDPISRNALLKRKFASTISSRSTPASRRHIPRSIWRVDGAPKPNSIPTGRRATSPRWTRRKNCSIFR